LKQDVCEHPSESLITLEAAIQMIVFINIEDETRKKIKTYFESGSKFFYDSEFILLGHSGYLRPTL